MATKLLGTLGVKLSALTAEFSADIDSAVGDLKKVGITAQNVTAAAAIGFTGLTAAIGFAVNEASEARQALARLEAAAQGAGKELDAQRMLDFASSLQEVTTFGDDATVAAAAMLQTFGLNQDQMEQMLPRVQNLAAAMQTDLRSAAMQVGKAMTAGVGALSRMGISLTETQRAAFDAADPMQKVALLAEIIDSNVGDAARRIADTAGGAFVQLGNAAGDVAKEFGFIVDQPIKEFLQGTTGAVLGIANGIAGLSDEAKKFVVGATAVTGALLGITAAGGGFVLLWPKIVAGWKAIGVAMRVAILPAAKILLALGAAIAGIVLIVGAFKQAWDANMLGIRDTLVSVGQSIVNAWGKVVEFMTSSFDKAADFLTEKFLIIKGLIQGLSAEQIGVQVRAAQAGAPIAPEIAEFANAAFETIKDAGVETFANLKKSWGEGISVFKDLLGVSDELTAEIEDTAAGAKQLAPEATKLSDIMASASVETDKSAKKIKTLGAEVESFVEPIRDLGSTVAKKFEDGLIGMFEAAAPIIGDRAAGAIVDSISTAASILGPAMRAAGQKTSSAIEGAAQGFQIGGPLGAVVGAIAGLVSQTESFGRILGSVEESFSFMGERLEPFVEMFEPLITSLISFFEVIQLLSEKIGITSFLLGILGKAFHLIADGLNAVSKFMINAWNSIVSGVAKTLGKIPGIGDKLEKNLMKLRIGLQDMSENVKGIIFEDVFEKSVLEDAADSISEMSDAAQEATESLLNVPTGFKIARARFEAATPDVGGGPGRPEIGGALGQEINISIEATDPQDLWAKLNQIEGFANFVRGGSTVMTGGPFSVGSFGT